MFLCKFNDQSQDGNTKSTERSLKLTFTEQTKDVIDLCEPVWSNNLVNKKKKKRIYTSQLVFHENNSACLCTKYVSGWRKWGRTITQMNPHLCSAGWPTPIAKRGHPCWWGLHSEEWYVQQFWSRVFHRVNTAGGIISRINSVRLCVRGCQKTVLDGSLLH